MFRSAREFCAQLKVGISYPQYSRYETGEQLPNLDHALEICRLLKVPALEGLLQWNRAQVTDPELLRSIERLLGRSNDAREEPAAPPRTPGVPLDDVIVFNRSHLKLFRSDPAYRDVFTYVNSFSPEAIPLSEISGALGLAPAKLASMVRKLADHGVIDIVKGAPKDSEERCRATKSNFYFPDDEDFFELRNSNLSRNVDAILAKLSYQDVTTRKAYRGLITRELTALQLAKVIEDLEKLSGEVVELPETSRPDRIYSLCVLLGERYSRKRLDPNK